MRKIGALIFCLCAALVSTSFAQARQKPKSGKSVKKKVPETSCGLPASVTALRVNHTDISSVCPEGAKECSACPRIEVATTAMEPEGVSLHYVYSITAGKIIGSGANVIWDLSAVRPGEYTITAAIDMGKPWGVLGQTQTKRVRVLDCVGCKSDAVKTPDNK